MSSDPAWLDALADFQVTRRGNNTCDSQKPSGVASVDFRDIFMSWCGGCLDDDNDVFYTGPGAGHTNYNKAEVYGYDIFGTEEWFQATTPSSAGTLGVDTDGQKTDGSPLSTHTYDLLVFVQGELWLPGMGSVSTSGNTSARGWTWNPASPDLPSAGTRGWTTLGLNTLDGADNGAVAYDPLSDRILFAHRTPGGNRSIGSWVRTTKVRTEHIVTSSITFGNSGGDMTAVVVPDGVGGSYYIGRGNGVNGRATQAVKIQTLIAGGAVAWTVPVWTGTPLPVGKCRVHYVPETGQLITWEQGTNNIVVANKPANPGTGTYTWFRKALTGLTITPPSGTLNGGNVNGTFGRFQVFRSPSGRLCCFLINETTEQPHIWPLPPTPITP